MNILVTGGSGKLAKYIAQEFSDHDLMLMDVVPPPEDREGLPCRQGDVTCYDDCKEAIAACEPQVILALGALPWPTDETSRRAAAEADGRTLPPFDTTIRVNVLGLYYLMQAAVEAGVETVIQTSSIVTIVGEGTDYQYLPVDDDHPSCPTNSYNYSKMAGELMLQWFTRTFGIQTLCARPAWNWTPEALKAYAQEVQPATRWEGGGLWHYVDTRDVATAHRQMFDARDRLLDHDAFLIHAADHRAMEDSRELVETFRPDLLESIPVYLRGRQAFVSCEKAHNAFGYEARYSWTDWL
jgi:nucleoside-diphosphate-sugar epimerase